MTEALPTAEEIVVRIVEHHGVPFADFARAVVQAGRSSFKTTTESAGDPYVAIDVPAGTPVMGGYYNRRDARICANIIYLEHLAVSYRCETVTDPAAIVMHQGDIPDTLLSACAGRCIGDVLGHPALRGLPLIVERAYRDKERRPTFEIRSDRRP